MKRLLVFAVIALLAAVSFIAFKNKVKKDLTQPVNIPTTIPSVTVSPVITGAKTRLSLFVPYWTLTDEKIATDGFDKIIYFGIKPNEQNPEQLEKFNDSVPQNTRKLLTLRMTESQENTRVLSDLALQKNIIDQTIEAAKSGNMKGVVLDLELSAIPFDSTLKQINKFAGMLYQESKKNKLTFSIALYGDLFYRARPFDAKTLSQNSDEIMIMAYDMNKAKGNPGPNFPLAGRDKFGYDLREMADDFLKIVPARKITFIFGLFGYDWIVDEQGKAIKQAEALTYSQIKQKFIDPAKSGQFNAGASLQLAPKSSEADYKSAPVEEFKNFSLNRDKESVETQIRYTDEENKNHIIWFEDMESIRQKKEYLQQRGINSFSYWAYSYY